MSDVLNYDAGCLFCKIIKGEIPSAKVYEDDLCYAFKDIDPRPPSTSWRSPRPTSPPAPRWPRTTPPWWPTSSRSSPR